MVYRSAYFSTSAGIAPNVLGLCVRWGFPALKPNSSNKLKLSTNDK